MNIYYVHLSDASVLPAFGGGSGVIFIDNVHCDGSEDNIISCIYLGTRI